MRDNLRPLRYYLDEIGNISVLSRQEEMTLMTYAKSGDRQAAEKLICANLRFVVKIAREYQNRGLPLADLISEGNVGLIRALETFDPHKGMKFITYAVWWIRQSILQALFNKGHQVRLPQNRLRQQRSMLKIIESLEKKLERSPAPAEIEEVIGEKNSITTKFSTYLQNQESLEAPLDHHSAKRLINIIPNENSSLPDAGLKFESLKEELREAFKVLTKRESTILQLLFGLERERPFNLGEVGEKMGISRERVRQIRNEALDKLRKTKHVKNTLRSFLG